MNYFNLSTGSKSLVLICLTLCLNLCIWSCKGYHSANSAVAESSQNLTAIYRENRLKAEANCLVYDAKTGRNFVKDHCTLFYVHVHKSGGSTVCQTAINAGYRVGAKERNCNIPPDLDTRENSELYLEYIRDHHLTFVAQESVPFNPNLHADNVLYFTTVRNPLDRIISHLHHETCAKLESGIHDIPEAGNCSVDWKHISAGQLITDECLRNASMFSSISNLVHHYFAGCEDKCTAVDLVMAEARLEILSAIVVLSTHDEYSW